MYRRGEQKEKLAKPAIGPIRNSVEIIAIALSGMVAARERFERAAARAAHPEQDSVDLSAEAVAMLESRNAFALNARVAHEGGEMEKEALDILA